MIDVRTPHAHDVYFVHDTVRKNIKRNTRYDIKIIYLVHMYDTYYTTHTGTFIKNCYTHLLPLSRLSLSLLLYVLQHFRLLRQV